MIEIERWQGFQRVPEFEFLRFTEEFSSVSKEIAVQKKSSRFVE